MRGEGAQLAIEWPVTDAHTLRRTITREEIERREAVREALVRYGHVDRNREPDEDADIRDRWTVREWLEEVMESELASATHALARTLVLGERTEEDGEFFGQDPAQATRVQGSCGYRPEDHATEEWEEMKRKWGEERASVREAAERGARRALETELADWIEGEGEGMYLLAGLLE